MKKVYQAKDEIDANLIVGYLVNNGIKAVAMQSTDNMPPLFSGEFRSMARHMVSQDIFVPEPDADEAMRLIHEVRDA